MHMPAVYSLAQAAASNLDVWHLIANASPVVKVVMAILALMSVITWYIVGYKYFRVRRAIRQSESFEEAFWRGRDIQVIYSSAQGLKHSPLSAMFLAGYNELAKLQQHGSSEREGDLENIERSLMKAQLKETARLESAIPFLATTGSSAPFIGLFGTVWGIMNSFRAIGAMKSASVANVAPGIAEALIATAIGLVAAIPAVMAYNYFTRKTRLLSYEMDTFTKDFLNIVRRHFLK
jgi:biopolymer transport protein TolQ